MAGENEQSWTIQQFTEVAGRSWYSLQQRNEEGEIQKQFTGYRTEMDELANKLNVKPKELAPTTEEKFYESLSRPELDKEMGRQLGAAPAQGIRASYGPYDLDAFHAGFEERQSEERRQFARQIAPAETQIETKVKAQALASPAKMSTPELVAEAQGLHQQFERLHERYEQSPASARAEVREEMRPVVQRENELRAEYGNRVAPELTRDRVPEGPQAALGY